MQRVICSGSYAAGHMQRVICSGSYAAGHGAPPPFLFLTCVFRTPAPVSTPATRISKAPLPSSPPASSKRTTALPPPLQVARDQLQRTADCVYSHISATSPPDARARSYSLLGVEPDASSAAIKKAYHRLALEKHPDRNNPISQPAPTHIHEQMLTRAQERQYSRQRGRVPGAGGGAQGSLAVLL
jgi:hypothetical protein